MPNDSIYHSLTDTISIVPTDSLSYLQNTLTSQMDTLSAIAPVLPSGFEGVSLSVFPESANWVFGLLLGLFALLVIGIRLSPSFISEDIKSIFRVNERTSIFSNTTANQSILKIALTVFALCILSLYAYIYFFLPESGDFSIITYAYFLVATSSFFIFKLLVIKLLGYIFFDEKKTIIAQKTLLYVIILLGIIIFPILIINIYGIKELSNTLQIVSYIVLIACSILIGFRLFQIFFSKLLDSFYILLYLCTLEILPLLVLFHVYKLIV